MKIIIHFLYLFLLLPYISFSYAQNGESPQDTIGTFEKNRKAFLNSPERIKVVKYINEVNSISSKVDLISSQNVVKIKAASMNQTGIIEVRTKKQDSLWFQISGKFAFITKEAVTANVNRANFIYFDNLNDKVIEGPTTDNNIGAIARIKCTFDDLLNVMSGTGRIVYTEEDTLSMITIESKDYISVKGFNKNVQYVINPENKYIEKYSYINSGNKEFLKITYGNFVPVNGGFYARKVDIEKPLSKEFMKIANEDFTVNNSNLDFKVNFPSDVRRVKWDK